MKKIKSISSFVLVLLIAVLCVFAGGCSGNDESSSSDNNSAATSAESNESSVNSEGANPDSFASSDDPVAVIDVKDYGKITVELYPKAAPNTVKNFVKLAKDGFYDGLTFHRIISGFMIQGGDPLGTGMGGSDETIEGEFANNGIENNLSHTRGVISMARSQDMNSASSQFFIVHQDSPHLDGDYAAFGCVTDGIEVVDKICENTPVVDGNGTVEKANQPVINSIKITNE